MALNCYSIALQQRRLECLTLILQWRGAKLRDGEVEKVDLAAQDEVGHTVTDVSLIPNVFMIDQ